MKGICFSNSGTSESTTWLLTRTKSKICTDRKTIQGYHFFRKSFYAVPGTSKRIPIINRLTGRDVSKPVGMNHEGKT